MRSICYSCKVANSLNMFHTWSFYSWGKTSATTVWVRVQCSLGDARGNGNCVIVWCTHGPMAQLSFVQCAMQVHHNMRPSWLNYKQFPSMATSSLLTHRCRYRQCDLHHLSSWLHWLSQKPRSRLLRGGERCNQLAGNQPFLEFKSTAARQ